MKGSSVKNFRDLVIWQKGVALVSKVYKETSKFPKIETYGLVSQIRRCSISIPSNVAEGFNRHHNKEYIQFLYIALGSCSELETQVEISESLGFLEKNDGEGIVKEIQFICAMTHNLIKSLKSRTR